ncbi:hypothetical protein CEXT_709711 [Caerostris extrusa]|uniref:Uncharacterized protein n=1 Tax=Caerostris extrusa TaxID=172846 RepID=A0AAV4SV30_CAEEX|nr:hypothetical protein CEXT_709711 [Caerostris extrusa]
MDAQHLFPSALSNTEYYSPHGSRIDTAVTCWSRGGAHHCRKHHVSILCFSQRLSCGATDATRVDQVPAGNIIFRLPINLSWHNLFPYTGHNR